MSAKKIAGGVLTVVSLVGPPIKKQVTDASTANVRNSGLMLVANLRDSVLSGSDGNVSYNAQLVVFTRTCMSAARLRARRERRQKLRNLATLAAEVSSRMTAYRADEPGAPDRTMLLMEISTLESHVVAL